MDDFAIFACVGPIGIFTMPSGMEIFESQGHGSLCWTPGGWRMEWRIQSPSRRGDILLGAPPNFGSFRAAKMTPFWDSNFTPRVVNWRPHISMPTGSPDLISSCTLRYES